jgi:hypothetical protein
MKTIDGIEIKAPARYDIYYDGKISLCNNGDYILTEKYEELESDYQDAYDTWQNEKERADIWHDKCLEVEKELEIIKAKIKTLLHWCE